MGSITSFDLRLYDCANHQQNFTSFSIFICNCGMHSLQLAQCAILGDDICYYNSVTVEEEQTTLCSIGVVSSNVPSFETSTAEAISLDFVDFCCLAKKTLHIELVWSSVL